MRYPAAIMFVLVASWRSVEATTPLITVGVSPDITASVAGNVVRPNAVLQDTTSVLNLVSPGGLPASVDLDAFHVDGAGRYLLSLDVANVVDGLAIGHGDVVSYDGANYLLVFNAMAAGVPDGVDVDAVSRFNGELVLSFDTTVALSGITFADEDLARFGASGFTLFFDASAAGVATAADVDAAHALANGRLLVSFAAGGSVGGITYDHADVLEYDPVADAWALAYRATVLADWGAADVDAFSAVSDLDTDGVTDEIDNCQLHENVGQRDTDGDGLGNRCDPDFDQNCITDFVDLGFMKSVFFSGDAHADLDGSGSVDFVDLGIMKSLFFLSPGPSGIANVCP